MPAYCKVLGYNTKYKYNDMQFVISSLVTAKDYTRKFLIIYNVNINNYNSDCCLTDYDTDKAMQRIVNHVDCQLLKRYVTLLHNI